MGKYRPRYPLQAWQANILSFDMASRKTVTIPLEPAPVGGPITFTLSQVLVHHSHPLPASIGQDDEQYLMFETNQTMVESLYSTRKETIKYRYGMRT